MFLHQNKLFWVTKISKQHRLCPCNLSFLSLSHLTVASFQKLLKFNFVLVDFLKQSIEYSFTFFIEGGLSSPVVTILLCCNNDKDPETVSLAILFFQHHFWNCYPLPLSYCVLQSHPYLTKVGLPLLTDPSVNWQCFYLIGGFEWEWPPTGSYVWMLDPSYWSCLIGIVW